MSTAPAAAAPAAAPAKEDMKKKRIYQLIMAVAGTVLTWLVWNPNSAVGYAGMSNIIASAGFGLIAGVLFKKHFDIFYAGTFAGMSAVAVVPDIGWAIVVGVMVFVLWVVLEKKLIGVGGKFGTTAMLSGVIVSFFIWVISMGMNPATTYVWPILGATNNAVTYNQLDWIICVLAPLIGAAACSATIIGRNRGELCKNTTVGSAVIGLLGAFLFLLITVNVPNSTKVTYGIVFAQICYSASFAGMASKDRLDCCGKFKDHVAFAITGLIVGGIFIALYGLLGFGGKFGFIGALSVLVYNKLIVKLLKKNQKPVCEDRT